MIQQDGKALWLFLFNIVIFFVVNGELIFNVIHK